MTRPGIAARLLLVIACALAVAALGTSTAAGTTSASCEVLKSNTHLRATLRKVHVALQNKSNPDIKVRGPRGHVYYGKCGTRFFAFATFQHKIPGQPYSSDDQPEYFKRAAHRPWRDKGDTGGDVCGTDAPAALLAAWGFTCPAAP